VTIAVHVRHRGCALRRHSGDFWQEARWE
jgi:hypothetical protein